MSQENVVRFLNDVCHDKTLQDKIKAAEDPLPLTVYDIAADRGYEFTKLEIAEYVNFNTFYPKFQTAIAKHQKGQQNLSNWLKKWQAYVTESELEDASQKMSRYIK